MENNEIGNVVTSVRIRSENIPVIKTLKEMGITLTDIVNDALAERRALIGNQSENELLRVLEQELARLEDDKDKFMQQFELKKNVLIERIRKIEENRKNMQEFLKSDYLKEILEIIRDHPEDQLRLATKHSEIIRKRFGLVIPPEQLIQMSNSGGD